MKTLAPLQPRVLRNILTHYSCPVEEQIEAKKHLCEKDVAELTDQSTIGELIECGYLKNVPCGRVVGKYPMLSELRTTGKGRLELCNLKPSRKLKRVVAKTVAFWVALTTLIAGTCTIVSFLKHHTQIFNAVSRTANQQGTQHEKE